eukprot:gene16917-23218_t
MDRWREVKLDCGLLGPELTELMNIRFPVQQDDDKISAGNGLLRYLGLKIPEVSASAIKNNYPECYDMYAQVCYAGTYVPNERIRELIAMRTDKSEQELLCARLIASIPHPVSFRKFNCGSETAVVDPCFQLVLNLCTSNKTIAIKRNITDMNCMSFSSCNPEPYISYPRGVTLNSLRYAVTGQSISLKKFGLSLADAAVPAIAFCGNSFQFGAVYLVEPCFPMFVVLSRVLSPFSSHEEQLELCSWLVKFKKISLRTCDLIDRVDVLEDSSITKPMLDMSFFLNQFGTIWTT